MKELHRDWEDVAPASQSFFCFGTYKLKWLVERIQQSQTRAPSKLKERDPFWIYTLETLTASGLNKNLHWMSGVTFGGIQGWIPRVRATHDAPDRCGFHFVQIGEQVELFAFAMDKPVPGKVYFCFSMQAKWELCIGGASWVACMANVCGRISRDVTTERSSADIKFA